MKSKYGDMETNVGLTLRHNKLHVKNNEVLISELTSSPVRALEVLKFHLVQSGCYDKVGAYVLAIQRLPDSNVFEKLFGSKYAELWVKVRSIATDNPSLKIKNSSDGCASSSCEDFNHGEHCKRNFFNPRRILRGQNGLLSTQYQFISEYLLEPEFALKKIAMKLFSDGDIRLGIIFSQAALCIDPNIFSNNGKFILEFRCQNQIFTFTKDDSNIVDAAKSNNADGVLALLKSGVNPDLQDAHGNSALMFACKNGNLRMVIDLLDAGANVNLLLKDNWTALFLACEYGHDTVVKHLLKQGAWVNHHEKSGWTALMLASEYGHLNVVESLIAHGAEIDQAEQSQWTASLLAAEFGHTEVFSALYRSRAASTHQEKSGWTALMLAAERGYYEIVELVNDSDTIMIENHEGWTALMFAASHAKDSPKMVSIKPEKTIAGMINRDRFDRNRHPSDCKRVIRALLTEGALLQENQRSKLSIESQQLIQSVQNEIVAEYEEQGIKSDLAIKYAAGRCIGKGNLPAAEEIIQKAQYIHSKVFRNSLSTRMINLRKEVKKTLLVPEEKISASEKTQWAHYYKKLGLELLSENNVFRGLLLLEEAIKYSDDILDNTPIVLSESVRIYTNNYRRKYQYTYGSDIAIDIVATPCGRHSIALIEKTSKKEDVVSSLLGFKEGDAQSVLYLTLAALGCQLVMHSILNQQIGNAQLQDYSDELVPTLVRFGHFEMLKYMVNQRGVVIRDDVELLSVADKDNDKLMEFLLRYVTLKKFTRVRGVFNFYSPLVVACRLGNSKTVRHLLNSGADVNEEMVIDSNRIVSALRAATYSRSAESVRLLLEKCQPPLDHDTGFLYTELFTNKNQFSSLDDARNWLENNQLLHTEGTLTEESWREFMERRILFETFEFYKIYIVSLTQSSLDIIKLFVERGARVTTIHSTKGKTPLHYVCKGYEGHPGDRSIEVVNYILEKAGDIIHQKDKKGRTAFDCISVRSENLVLIEYMLDRGAIPSNIDDLFYRLCDLPKATGLLKKLHHLGATISKTQSGNQSTALKRAASGTCLENIKFLLSHGASMDEIADDRQTALTLFNQAVKLGSAEIVTPLLNILPQEDVCQVNNEGETALQSAVSGNHTQVVQVLLASEKFTGDVNYRKNEYSQTAFEMAVEKGQVEMVRTMLASEKFTPELVCQLNKWGETALHSAVKGNHTQVVQVLLASEKFTRDVNYRKYEYSQTAFEMAVEKGLVEIVRVMLASEKFTSEAVCQVNKEGETALHSAVKGNHTQVVQVLLASEKFTADLKYRKNEYTLTALEMAVEKGQVEMVRAMLASEKFTLEAIYVVDRRGDTVLHRAAYEGSIEIVEVLLASEKFTSEAVCQVNNEGETALRSAFRGNHTQVVHVLLASEKFTSKAVSQIDERGDTLLHDLVYRSNLEMMQALLGLEKFTSEAVCQVDDEGNTLLHLAVMKRNVEIMEALLASEKFTSEAVCSADKKGWTVLHWAARQGYMETIEALLLSDKLTSEAVWHFDNDGRTALMLAVNNNQTEVVNTLLASPKHTPEVFCSLVCEGKMKKIKFEFKEDRLKDHLTRLFDVLAESKILEHQRSICEWLTKMDEEIFKISDLRAVFLKTMIDLILSNSDDSVIETLLTTSNIHVLFPKKNANAQQGFFKPKEKYSVIYAQDYINFLTGGKKTHLSSTEVQELKERSQIIYDDFEYIQYLESSNTL